MQKAFEKKLSSVNDDMKKRDERESKIEERIAQLTESLSTLMSERDGFWKTASLIGQFLFMEIFVACVLLYFCCRSNDERGNGARVPERVLTKRRQSIDTVGHETPAVKKSRRPSEEALKIAGTYEDLMIKDGEWLSKAERRRRRKKSALLRTQSAEKDKLDTLKRSQSFNVGAPRKQSAPAQIYLNGDVGPPVPRQLEDLPFPLEESEHAPVENLQVYNQENQVPNAKVRNGVLKASLLKSSPLFMKTALSSRSKRAGKLSFFKTDRNGKLEAPTDSSQRPDGSYSDSADDRSSVSSSSTKKKSGFKRIFKQIFE